MDIDTIAVVDAEDTEATATAHAKEKNTISTAVVITTKDVSAAVASCGFL
ncbi:hypothetical protein [Cytobacillus horneckiae]